MSPPPATAPPRPSSTSGAGRSCEKLPDLIVPFKRDAYLEVVKAFAKVPAGIRG